MHQVSISIDFVRIRALIDSRTGAARCLTRARTATLSVASVALAVFAFLCAGAPAARAANFTCTWTDASDNWATVGDWSSCNSTFPNNGGGNTYDATISTGDPTLTTAVTIGSVTITSPGAWTLTGAGAQATLTGTLTNSGTVALDGTAALTVTSGFTNSGPLNVDANLVDGGGSLTVGGTLANTGAVQIGNSDLGATTTATLGGLTNPSGASFEVIGSASHAATLAFSSGGTGFTSNGGTFLLSDTTPLTLPGPFTNSGTVALDGTAALTVTSGFTNSGPLNVDANLVDGGGSLTVGGTLANTGAVQIGNSDLGATTTATLGGLTNPSGASFEVIGSASHAATLAFSSGGTGFTSNGGTFLLSDTTPLTLPGPFTNSGTVALDGTAALTVTSGFTNSGPLNVDANLVDGGGSLTVGGTLANTGAVQIGNSDLGATTTATLGGLTNPSGASFEVIGSASHAATLAFSSGGTGFTSNGGTFLLSDTTPLTLPGPFTNSGTVALDGTAALTVTSGFTNSGPLNVDANLVDGGGSLTVGGTLANTGAVQIGNSDLGATTTATLGGLTNPSGASFEVIGSASHAATLAFSSGGTGFTSNGGTFLLSDTTPLTLPGPFTNSGTVALDGTAALTVTSGFTNSGPLNVDANLVDGGGSLTVGGTLANTGAVQIGNSDLGATTTATLGGLTNPSGASFEVIGSASHAATLAFSSGGTGFTSNGGTFLLSDTTPLTLPGPFTNSGTVALDGTAALTVTSGFTNSGPLNVDANLVDGGGSLTVGGTLANTGAVQIGNSDLGATTTATLGGLTNPSGASFEVIGSASHAATLAFSSGGTGFTSNGGTFLLSDTTPLTLPGPFTNSGTVALDGTAALTVTSGFTNSGPLNVDANLVDGGGSLTVGGTLANTGAVQIGNSDLGATTTATLGGLTNPSGASFEVIGSASHAATLAFSSGGTGFTSNGGTFLLSDTTPLTLPGPFTNSGTVALDGTAALTVTSGFTNSGPLNVDANLVDGGGSLTVGGTLANTGAVQIGNSDLGATTTATLGGLTNQSTGTLDVLGSATNQAALKVVAASGTTASNAGTLALREHAALSTSAGVNLSNTGLFNVDTGGGAGSSTATIGGVLSNTAALNIGNTALSAPTTVTAAGFTNSGTVNLLGNTTAGSTNQATITVNGQASNSGTLNLPTATSVTVTGAGNAYAQTAGFTNLSGGTLTAPSVNINGGTLQGLGTVAGALNIASTGSIQAINLANSSLAAVLTVNGNYAQSGGAFDALLHGTGTQIDAVSVGSGDSVHLTGGNLQVSGVTFAAGQVFNDIMTFQPGDLSGTFATLQGGGNGNSVNLGGGLTLQAMYNNAAGNISLDVIPTPPPVNPANPSITPTTIDFGNVRIGTTQQQALSVTNVAGTPPQASLDAQISATAGSATSNNGTITQLGPGSTDTTSLVAGLSTAAAGAESGTATVALQSDATTAGCTGVGCVTPLPSQNIIVQGNVFRLATGSATSPQDIGAARVGIGTLSGDLSVTNTAANDGSSENLDAAITATTPDVTGSSGQVTGLAAGQTNSTGLNVTLNNSTAGSKSGTATVQFQSDGTGIDGGAPVDNGSQVVTVTGNVYTPAVANVVTTSPVDFGIVHVGDGGGSLAQSVTVQNRAAATALNDVLIGTISAGGAPFSGSGNLGAGLGPQASSSALQVALGTGTAGIFSGTANLALASHDSQLADLALATSPLSLSAQVNRYAALALEQTGGDGILTGSGMSYDLDFGNVMRGSPTQEALLAILNDNPLADQAFTDLLSTSPSGAAVPFSLTGCSANGLPGGDRQSCDVLFDTSSLGRFMDSVTFDVESSNASGYDQIIGDVTLNLDGNIVSRPVPEPGSIAVLVSGLFMLFFVIRRERRRR